MLGAILMVSVGANIYLVIRANSDPSFAVEPDYYAKAVDWDDIQAQKAESEALGWSISVNAEPAQLRIRLTDRLGQPISAAMVEVEAFHNARAADRTRGVMIPRGDGVYILEAAFDRPGLWEYRITATTGDYTYRHVAREEVP